MLVFGEVNAMDETTGTLPSDPTRIVEKVRERYGRIATGEESGCCGPAAGPTCGNPAAEGGFGRVEFRQGRLESLPVEDASVDAVTSNCVINLVPDKSAVFREVARVLRPGGRLVISDIVLDGPLPEAVATDLLAYVGCVAGAMQRRAYFDLVQAAGLTGLRIHKDVDYLAAAGYALPADLQSRLDRNGVRPGDLEGKVRSLTWSASKP